MVQGNYANPLYLPHVDSTYVVLYDMDSESAYCAKRYGILALPTKFYAEETGLETKEILGRAKLAHLYRSILPFSLLTRTFPNEIVYACVLPGGSLYLSNSYIYFSAQLLVELLVGCAIAKAP